MGIKYKFTSTTDTLPTFNSNFEYTYTDVDNGDGTTTRTINYTVAPTSMNFQGQTGLLEVLELDISGLTSLENMFRQTSNCTVIHGIENWDTSKIKSLASTFRQSGVTSIDLSKWDVSSVTTFYYMCFNTKLTSIGDLKNWNVSSVTTMNSTFDTTSLTTLGDISSWDVSKVTNFGSMFANSKFTSLDISNWKYNETTTSNITFAGMFTRCSSLIEIIGIEKLPVHKTNSLQTLFYNCSKMSSFNIKNWDVSNITNLNQIFRGCSSITTLDLSSWNLEKVETTERSFSDCTNLETLNLSGWNTVLLTNMNYTFSGCSKLNTLNLSKWNTLALTSTTSIFANVNALTNVVMYECSVDTVNTMISLVPNKTSSSYGIVDVSLSEDELSNIDTATVTSKMWNIVNRFLVAKYKMQADSDTLPNSIKPTDYIYADVYNNDDGTVTRTIYNTDKLSAISFINKTGLLEVLELDITSKITNLGSLFDGCTNLTSINTTDWDTQNATSMLNMFKNCNSLTSLDLSNFNTAKVTNMGGMFNGCKLLTSLDLSSFNTGKNSSMASMFANCQKITSLNLSHFNTLNVTAMNNTFQGCSSLTSLDLSSFNTEKVTSLNYTFDGCSSLTSVNISNWNVGKVVNMSYAFQNCSSLTSLDLSNWDVQSVTNMTYMFFSCKSLTSLNVSNWNTQKNGTVLSMFQYCSSLTSLDLSGWNTQNITTMRRMFNGCSSLISLDLSSFNTEKVTEMSEMFRGCSSLTSLNLSSFNTKQVTNTSSMLQGCSALTSLDLSSFNTEKVANMGSMFNGCTSLTTLDLSNWHTISTTNMNVMFSSATKLTDIGLLYSNETTVNMVANSLPNNPINVYYYDADETQLIPINKITFVKYVFPVSMQLPPHIQLHSLPDGTRDEVDIKTGILTRRVGYSDAKIVNKDKTQTYYISQKPYREKLTPTVTNQDGTIVDLSSFKIWDSRYVNTSDNVQVSGNTVTSIANSCGVEKDYFIIAHNNGIKTGYLKSTDITKSWYCTYEDTTDKGLKVEHTDSPEAFYFDNLNLKQGETYRITIRIEAINKYQYLEICEVINPNYTNSRKTIITDTKAGVNSSADPVKIYTAEYQHTSAAYSRLRVSVRGGITASGSTTMTGEYYLGVIVEQITGDIVRYESYTIMYPNIMLNGIDEYKDELNLLTGGVTRQIVSRDYVEGDELSTYPTTSSYTQLYNKEKVLYKIDTPTTEQLILNYKNSCDYGRILPTGVQDKYNVVTNEYYQTMETIVLDGKNVWLEMEDLGSVLRFTAIGETVEIEELNMLGAGGLYCDNDLFPNINDDSDVEHCRVDEEGNKFYIYISKERLMSPDLIGYQIWLQQNKFNMTYELAVPQNIIKPYEELDPMQAKWNTLDSMRDCMIYLISTDVDDDFIITPTFEYVAPSSNNFYLDLLLPNTEYTIYAEGINEEIDTINLGGVTTPYTRACLMTSGDNKWVTFNNNETFDKVMIIKGNSQEETVTYFKGIGNIDNPTITIVNEDETQQSTISYPDVHLRSLPTGERDYFDAILGTVTQNVGVRPFEDGDLENMDLITDGISTLYPLTEPTIQYVAPQPLLAYDNGKIKITSDTGLVTTLTYAVPFSNTYRLPHLKTGTLYTIKYPSASGTITIGDITYNITSDSMLFTTPLVINGDTSAIIFSDENPQNVILLEGGYSNREVAYFAGIKSVSNPIITIIDNTVENPENVEYKPVNEIELRSLPNGVADLLDIVKQKVTISVGYRHYQEGDEYLDNVWTDGYNTAYALEDPVVRDVKFVTPVVSANSTMKLSSNGLIPQLNYRVPSTNNFPLDLLLPNTTYTLYGQADTPITYSLGGVYNSTLMGAEVISLGNTNNNLLTFNGDISSANVMLVKGNTTGISVPYFQGVKSVNNIDFIIEGLQGERNTMSLQSNVSLRACGNIKDSIDMTTCILKKELGEVVLNGNESWFSLEEVESINVNYVLFACMVGGAANSQSTSVICNRFNHKYLSGSLHQQECVYCTDNQVRICIKKTTIGGNNITALKTWLGQNNVSVIYALRTPLSEKLTSVWETMPPTSYNNQTTITTQPRFNTPKPMITITVATTTLEQIISELQSQNTQLENENVTTMMALTSFYETFAVSTISDGISTINLSDGKDSSNLNGMSISPMSMIYAKLIKKGLKTIEQVPTNLQVEVKYVLKE